MSPQIDLQSKRPEEYKFETSADGVLHVVHVPKLRVYHFRLLLFVGMWFLVISIALAGGGGSYPPVDDGFKWHKVLSSLQDPSKWLLTGFMLMGLLCILSGFWWLFSWDEMWVAPGLLEVRYYLLGWCHYVRRYTSGRIYMERHAHRDSESNDVTGYQWWLYVGTGRRRGIIASAFMGGVRPDDGLCHLAEELSKQTGWELEPIAESHR